MEDLIFSKMKNNPLQNKIIEKQIDSLEYCFKKAIESIPDKNLTKNEIISLTTSEVKGYNKSSMAYVSSIRYLLLKTTYMIRNFDKESKIEVEDVIKYVVNKIYREK